MQMDHQDLHEGGFLKPLSAAPTFFFFKLNFLSPWQSFLSPWRGLLYEALVHISSS